MPAYYAHYRFGQMVAPQLPATVRKAVKHFPQLFEVGLQGPDIFFYHNPVFRSKVVEQADSCHQTSGQAFFGQILERLRANPSEGSTAYLFGLLAHYALDSTCHPFINSASEQGGFGHVEFETEFDRFLLTQDGLLTPHTHDLSPHIRLTRGEWLTVSQFYPPVSAYAVGRSVRNMRFVVHALASPNRQRLDRITRMLGQRATQMVMLQHMNHHCSPLDEQLLALFNQAEERYSDLAEQLWGSIEDGTPLGDAFLPSFIQ